jgi:hypothetical protein
MHHRARFLSFSVPPSAPGQYEFSVLAPKGRRQIAPGFNPGKLEKTINSPEGAKATSLDFPSPLRGLIRYVRVHPGLKPGATRLSPFGTQFTGAKQMPQPSAATKRKKGPTDGKPIQRIKPDLNSQACKFIVRCILNPESLQKISCQKKQNFDG